MLSITFAMDIGIEAGKQFEPNALIIAKMNEE
jgi:hypothetical protein